MFSGAPWKWGDQGGSEDGNKKWEFWTDYEGEATESADDLHMGVRRGNLILSDPHNGGAVSRRAVGRSGTPKPR